MQSWADTGFGQLRKAGAFPSRAAVLGIVAAAQGVPRGDRRLVELHDAFRVHVATVRPGRVLRDFHTVEAVEGKAPTLTSRDYHHDAHFVALIESATVSAVDDAIAALHDPTFTAFLGRRSCPPSVPLLPAPVQGDGLPELIRQAESARRFAPNTGESRPSGRADRVTVYLDGSPDRLPAELAGARTTATYGSRRDRLVAPRRAYVDRPFTRVQISLSDVPE